MNILHLDFDDLESPTAGGQAVRTFEVNRRLARKGHHITVATLGYKGSKPETKEGVRYERFGLKTPKLNFLSYAAALPWIIKKYPADLVVEDNIPPFTFGFSPLFTKKPVVSVVQSFFARDLSRKYHLPFWRMENLGPRFYRNFIVLNKNLSQKIQKLNPAANVAVIGNGCYIPAEVTQQEKNFILYLGRLNIFTKGIDYLLDSMEILQKKAPDIKLIVAGTGPDENKISDIVRKKTLANVEFAGHVEGRAKEQLLQQCLMLVQPSRYEMFPFTFLEAGANSKPIVAFNIENVDELISEGIGVAAPAFNTEEFAGAIVDLAHNEAKRRQLGGAALEWAKRYSWNEIAAQQEQFYRSCLK